jgi:hypothetical protein
MIECFFFFCKIIVIIKLELLYYRILYGIKKLNRYKQVDMSDNIKITFTYYFDDLNTIIQFKVSLCSTHKLYVLNQ